MCGAATRNGLRRLAAIGPNTAPAAGVAGFERIDRIESLTRLGGIIASHASTAEPIGRQSDATRERIEMVAPARAYYVPVRPRCGNCGY